MQLNVKSSVLRGSLYKVVVSIDGGPEQIFRVVNDADLERQALAFVQPKEPVTTGVREVIAPEPPAPKVPTQDELDRQAAFQKLSLLQRVADIEKNIERGKASADPEVQTLALEVEAAYVAGKYE